MQEQSSPPAVMIKDLQVNYGPVTALSEVTLELSPGLIWAVLGMNGSGKSTLFKSLMGQVKVTTGEISIFGQPSLFARKQGWVGYVPQNELIDLHFPISVQDVVTMGRYGFLGLTRKTKTTDRQIVQDALETVGLVDLAQRPIGALSGGQRKRVFIARAIAQGARLLILDEPFAGVDKDSEALIVNLLRGLVKTGTTILVSTHDLSSVPKYCHQAVLINRKIQFQGSIEQALQPEILLKAFTNQKGNSRC